MGKGSRRRTVALTLAGLVAVGAPIATAVGANAAAFAPRPKVHALTLSTSKLPSGGGAVIVKADVRGARSCHLSVSPPIRNRPSAQRCDTGSVRWRLHLPRNRTVKAAAYHVALRAVAPGGAATTRRRRLAVAETPKPPTLEPVSTSRDTVKYVGGAVRVTASARRSRSCVIHVTPSVPDLPGPKNCSHRPVHWAVHLPANASMTATADYSITVTAHGTHGQRTIGQTGVTVGQHPPPCPGQTSTAPPATAAFFNDPTTRLAADQDRVVDAEINLICSAQLKTKGVATQINVADYIYELEPYTQALIWAQTYLHADVHVTLDGANNVMSDPTGAVVTNPAYNDLVAGLPAGSVLLCGPNAGHAPPPNDGDNDSDVFPAGTSCAGDNILHTKMLTVSSVDAAEDPAVFITSQNLGENAEVAAFNDGLQVVGDPSLYDIDTTYEGHLAQNLPDPMLGEQIGGTPETTQGATITSDFYPQNVSTAFPADDQYHAANDTSTDRPAQLLRTVDCADPGTLAGTHDATGGRTSIRIAMFTFGNRPQVMNALVALASAGCDIQVIYGSMTADDMTALTGAGIQPVHLNVTDFPFPDGTTGPVFAHDKFMLISGGVISGSQTLTDQDILQVGSPNFTQKALHRNDEASITYQQSVAAADEPVIFAAYASDFAHLGVVASETTAQLLAP